MQGVTWSREWEELQAQPLLTTLLIPEFRQQMKEYLSLYSTLEVAALLGYQSDTPSLAFLSGYQMAIRCLDPQCPPALLAAFCVSETGVRKPWDMTTHLRSMDQGWRLDGVKSHVMLAPGDLDRCYVMAKHNMGELWCVRCDYNSRGVTLDKLLSTAVVALISHASVVFKDVAITEEQVLTQEAHEQANKPFRYWEDVHVTVAMLAWMARQLVLQDEVSHQLRQSIEQLMVSFEADPYYYSLPIFTLLDEALVLLDGSSKWLEEPAATSWQQDRPLLLMGQSIRGRIQAKLASEQ